MMVCQTKGILRFLIWMVKKFQTETQTSSAVVASQTLQHLPDPQIPKLVILCKTPCSRTSPSSASSAHNVRDQRISS